MEDSFGDFQEKKKCKIGPKAAPKGKNKQKKPLKPTKGQKDLRSLIKNNEIVSYSNDFNKVCQQSGVDVDAEQLQLAIALSKSLNDIQSSSEDVGVHNRPLSSQERSARIRTTLQEYGFRVNGSKVSLSLSTNKRKKYSKNSKLLQISNEERQKKISDKYSKVLVGNSNSINDDSECNYFKDKIFYKATNITYECMKNDEIFYVRHLIAKATHKTCLLRDWSEIPGRPVSPEPLQKFINFDTIQCSQHELDGILMGSINEAQSIIISKRNTCREFQDVVSLNDNTQNNETVEMTKCVQSSNNDNESKVNDSQHLETPQNTDVVQSDGVPPTQDTTRYNEMEITNCVLTGNNDNESESNDSQNLQTPQNNVTIQSDVVPVKDFTEYEMEITNCIRSSNNESIVNERKVKIDNDKDEFQDVDLKNVNPNSIHLQVGTQKLNFQFRSGSPDLFDDECSIIEKNDSIMVGNNNKDSTVFMDLTKCANDANSNINIQSDVTKGKSNNTIEVTECVNDKSDNGKNVDLTSSGEVDGDGDHGDDLVVVDLTQEYDVGSVKNASLELEDTLIYEKNKLEYSPLCNDANTSKNLINGEATIVSSIANNSDQLHESGHEIGGKSKNSCENIIANEDECVNEEADIDLTQGSDHSEGNCSVNYPEFIDDNYENFNDTHSNDISLYSVKSVSLDKGTENHEEKHAHYELQHLNHHSDTNDSDIIISLKSGNSVSLDNEIENQNIDDGGLELNRNSDTHENDNIIISLQSGMSASTDNDVENHVIDDGLELIHNDNDINLSLKSVKSASSDNDKDNPDINVSVQEFKHNSNTLRKDNDLASLNSANNLSLNDEADIDLTQESEKSFEANDANDEYIIQYPEASYNDSEIEILANRNDISRVDNDELCDIDLTQVNDIDEVNDRIEVNGHSNSRLGKVDNVSIDYDDIFDQIVSKSKSTRRSDGANIIKESSEHNSEVFEISDKELNYSIRHCANEGVLTECEPTDCLPDVNPSTLTPIRENNTRRTNTPTKINNDSEMKTPECNDYIIKTSQVTPMADFDGMTTPERNSELEKYGLKPFKRKRAIQLLTYVYNQTHPVIQSCSPEEGPSKKFKSNNKHSPKKRITYTKSPKKYIDFGTLVNKDIYAVTSEMPDIRNVECDPSEWVFQNREKAKVHSCRVPLHIAFHNYVSCRRLLREAILRYEPVNIDIIHKDLVSSGHKYNPKDLLKFMDKKCVTVKTAENNMKSKRT